MEEHLRQTTATTEEERLQSTESSVKERLQQTTGSSARRQLQPTTDSSEIATAVVPVECTSTRAVVYPNSKSVVQPIIIENNKRQFPVTDADTTEELGVIERDLPSTTAATRVAGAEQKTPTGHRYNQIPSLHMEPTLMEEETSRGEGSHFGFTVTVGTAAEAHTCEGSRMLLEGWMTTAQHPGQSEESSARQTSFTKLAVEGEESDARRKADTSIDGRDEVSTEAEFRRSLSTAEDFNRAQGSGDVECLGEVREVAEKSEVEEVLPDGRPDHPTSTENVQYDNKGMHSDEHPATNRDVDLAVIKGAPGYDSEKFDKDFKEPDRPAQQMAGLGLVKPDEDYGASDVDTIGQDGPRNSEKFEGEKVLYSGIQTAISQSEFQGEADDMVDLVKTTRRLTVSPNREFEEDGCNGLGRGDQVRRNYDNFGDFHKRTRKKACYNLGRGEQRGVVWRIRLPQVSQSTILHCRTTTTQKLPSHEKGNVETRLTEGKQQIVPQLGWPTRHKTGFHQQELSQRPLGFRTLNRQTLGFRNRLCKLNRRPLGFRMLNRQPLGFRVHTCKLNRQSLGFRIHARKLNRQPLGFRKLNRQPPVLKADKHLVTCNQRDMHQGERFERHPPELNLHVKFSKLNRSLRLGFRPPELQTMIKSDDIKECRTAIRYHRSLAKTSRCSHLLQLLKQSTASSIRPSTRSKSLSSSTTAIEQLYIARR